MAEFRVPVGQVRPADRAANAARRVEALPEDVSPEDIRAEEATVGDLHGAVVSARGQMLFAILDGDLDLTTGETLASASARTVAQLQSVLRARAEQRRLPVLVRGIALSVGATLLLGLALWATRRAADRALVRLTRATHPRTVSRLGRDLWVFVDTLERALVHATAWALGIVVTYLWLTFVLRRFPYTRPWGDRLGGYLVDLLAGLATGALGALPGLFAVVLIFLLTRFVVRMVGVFFRAVEDGTITVGLLKPDTAGATRRITAVVIWIFALTVAYEYIPGSESDSFKAIGIFTGLMVSLGSAGLVNHVMSGLLVVYSRALRPGELIHTGDITGFVSEVGLLSTKLVTAKREEITIPNAVLAGTTVTNYSRLEGGALVAATATIGYDQPWRQVHALLLLAAERTPHVRKEPRPYVVQRALSDFAVQYEVRAHIETPELRFRVLSELHAQIQDAFNEFGVQIMVPAFEAQPERAVVVPKSKWFTAPARSNDVDVRSHDVPKDSASTS
ncbi:MAG TPA: mechanosensitive ion channel domain-containing protein [Methylomirabilota bacterium]